MQWVICVLECKECCLPKAANCADVLHSITVSLYGKCQSFQNVAESRQGDLLLNHDRQMVLPCGAAAVLDPGPAQGRVHHHRHGERQRRLPRAFPGTTPVRLTRSPLDCHCNSGVNSRYRETGIGKRSLTRPARMQLYLTSSWPIQAHPVGTHPCKGIYYA